MKKIILIIGIIIVSVVSYKFGFFDYLKPETIKVLLEQYPLVAPIIFMGVYALITVVFLPASLFTVLAGAIFGPFLGTLYVVIGATLGAVIAFLLGRTFLKKWCEEVLLKKNPTLARYNLVLQKNSLPVMFMLRLIPAVPFNGLNYFLGITKVKFKDYLMTTFFGIIPGTFAYVYLGGSLASLDIWQIVSALILLVIFSFVVTKLGKLYKQYDENEYDIAVIGAGSGGLNVAGFMNRIGMKVLLIDKTDEDIGGDCLNTGCVPSKALIHTARLVKSQQEVLPFVKNDKQVFTNANLEAVADYVREKINIFKPQEDAEYFRSIGMDVALGEAKFTGKNSLEVGGREVTFAKAVIATGSRPFVPPIKNIETANCVYTNESIFSVRELPKKLLVIGAGPIGVELGQAFAHLGSDVTIITNTKRIVPREDSDIAKVLQEEMKKDGVKFVFNSLATEVVDGKKLKTVSADKKDPTTKEQIIEFDALLIATGRQLNVEGLDIEKARIEKDESGRKLKISKKLQTTNKRVFVCGDVAGMHQFTHAAEHHAGLILKNFFSPFKKEINNDSLAWVTFTSPEIGTFGLNEEELKKRSIKHTVLEKTFEHDDRAIVDSYQYAKMKLFVDKKGILLGGTMVAPNAGELIQELILAQTHKMNISKLFAKIYPYPTATRINKSIISEYFAERLTLRVKQFLKVMY